MFKKIFVSFLLFSNFASNLCNDASISNDEIIITNEKTNSSKKEAESTITPEGQNTAQTEIKEIKPTLSDTSKTVQQFIVLLIIGYQIVQYFSHSDEMEYGNLSRLPALTESLFRVFLLKTFGVFISQNITFSVSEKLASSACVSGTHIVFDKSFLQTSSQSTLNFVIGHEIGHFFNPKLWFMRGNYAILIQQAMALFQHYALKRCDLFLKNLENKYPQTEYPIVSRCIKSYFSFRTFYKNNPLFAYILDTYFVTSLFNSYSRYKEKEADIFSLKKTGEYEGAIEYFSQLHQQEMSQGLWHTLKYYATLRLSTHPSHMSRIEYITEHYYKKTGLQY